MQTLSRKLKIAAHSIFYVSLVIFVSAITAAGFEISEVVVYLGLFTSAILTLIAMFLLYLEERAREGDIKVWESTESYSRHLPIKKITIYGNVVDLIFEGSWRLPTLDMPGRLVPLWSYNLGIGVSRYGIVFRLILWSIQIRWGHPSITSTGTGNDSNDSSHRDIRLGLSSYSNLGDSPDPQDHRRGEYEEIGILGIADNIDRLVDSFMRIDIKS